jgi:hypothetical protein
MEESNDRSWMVPIKTMLGSLKHGEVQACSIFNVPDKLRGANEDAYKPKHISLGFLHRGASHLQQMEGTKWHYMRAFLDRQGTTSAENIRSEVMLFVLAMVEVTITSSKKQTHTKLLK